MAKIKKLLNNKIVYLIMGAFIASIFNYFFNVRLIEKEQFHRTGSEKQDFVFELSQMLQKRIYNGEVFFWNLKNDAKKETILDSWEKYKQITIAWNENLPNYYFKLDIYFPSSKYTVADYSMYLKSNTSFRDFLRDDIQAEIIPLHGQLVELKKMISKEQKPDDELLADVGSDIEKLHAQIANYSEALCCAMSGVKGRAANNQKTSTLP